MIRHRRSRPGPVVMVAVIAGVAIASLASGATAPSGDGAAGQAPTRTNVSGGGERVAPQTGSRLRPGFGTGSRLGGSFGTGSRLGAGSASRQPVIPGPGALRSADPEPPPFIHPSLRQDQRWKRLRGRRPAPYWPHSNVYFGTGRYGLGIADWRLCGAPTWAIVGPGYQLDPRLGFGPEDETPEGVGSLDFPEDPPREPEPPPEPTPPSILLAREGAEALRTRSYDAASGVYARLVSLEPDEPEHRRRLALSLLGAGAVEDAAAAMMRAYLEAPEIAWLPFDAPGLLGGSAAETRRLVNRAVSLANRAGSAEASLLASVLMQGEGRETPALRMLERASEAGADDAVMDAMRLSLGG